MAELLNNRAQRIAHLKEIITELHQGTPAEAVRQKLKNLVQQVDSSEIAAMEQQLMDEGLPVEQVMAMCDLHAEVVREILVHRPHGTLLPGHPVEAFQRENRAIEEAIKAFETALSAVGGADDTPVGRSDLMGLRKQFASLMDIEKHYSRKENLLFPMLEKHGIAGPSKVMWGKDDEIRALLKGLGEALTESEMSVGELQVVREAIAQPAFRAMREMILKEEEILFPMALNALTEAEWGDIWSQSPEIGYCLVDPAKDYTPPKADLLNIEGLKTAPPETGKVVFDTGALSIAQVKGIFGALPVDITFVDADDCVRYFSGGADRVFARPKAIIGRKVQHCHPPSSMDVVTRIISDFRSGKESVCSFWIEVRGRFVYIRYFAVRDDAGQYLGTLEVTQDLTEARALEGERRLLAYDPPGGSGE